MSNTAPEGFVALPKSERQIPAYARFIGPVDPHERVGVSVYLRAHSSSQLENMLSRHEEQPGRHITREEYKASESIDPNDLTKVKEFARKYNLTIDEIDPVAHKVSLYGTAAAVSHAFATELQRYEYEGKAFRCRSGPLHIPSELDKIVVGVFGLDNRPQARALFRRFNPAAHVFQAEAIPRSFTPRQVAQLYDFPTNLDGNGQCIAIIELGGGFQDQDLQTYFQRLNLPVPQITSVSVDGGFNNPIGIPDSDDGEVDLDIEIAGTIAPRAHIVVYFAPKSAQGFLDAVNAAIFDEENKPSVISISWGGPEITWTEQAVQLMDLAFQIAGLLGITVCCAAGDHGSRDTVHDGRDHVLFPASSPHVLGCGGTELDASDGTITSEFVWNAGPNASTGGGVSDFFGLPVYQANAHVPPSPNDRHIGRGVPDVAGNAAQLTGYQVFVDGSDQTIGGTSAVAPLWAGLIAQINQHRGQPVGFLNPVLYQRYDQLSDTNALRDITNGDNGDFTAGPGWDPCTGLGVPDGNNLLNTL